MPIRDNDPRPAYEQVADELRAAIAAGEYQPGDRLPSISALTEQHQIAPMTVRKALGLLEDEQLVVARQGRGIFVLEPPEPGPEPAPDPLVAVREDLRQTIGLLEQINERLDRHEAQRRHTDRDRAVGPEPDADVGRHHEAGPEPDAEVGRDVEPAEPTTDDLLDQAMADIRAIDASIREADAAARPTKAAGVDPYHDLGPPPPAPDRGPDLGI